MKHFYVFASAFLALTGVHAHSQVLNSSYPYICSTGQIYTVRAKPFPMAGINLSGIYQKFEAFCDPKHTDFESCKADAAPGTLKCFSEFRQRGNLRYISGKTAIQPGRIRQNPTSQWFEQIASSDPKLFQKVCRPAVVAMNCAKHRTTPGQQLKCLYEKSSFAARSPGRTCYSALNLKFNRVTIASR